MKKVLCLLLVVCMLCSFATIGFADEVKGSITINDAVKDQTYTIYKVLDLESYDEDAGAYAYKFATGWEGVLTHSFQIGTTTYTGSDFLEKDASGYVTWKKDADAAAFAKLARDYAVTKNLGNQGQVVKTTSTTVTFSNLDLGYYLVDSTLGALCSLDTTTPNVEMEEKNEEATVKKEVEEDSTGTFGKKNDADIGQTVNFKAVIQAKPGAEEYVLHDNMSEGLTLDKDSIKVKVGDAELTKGTDYTVEYDQACKDKSGEAATCAFHITFTKSYLDSITANTAITVTYSAKLNEKAVVAGAGNPNDMFLEYGDENRTEWDETKTYTWEVTVIKYTTVNGEEKKLAGATFELYRKTDNGGKEFVKFDSLGTNTYRVNGEGTVTSFTTDETGTIEIQGLDSDTYYLRETKAPDGYNKIDGDIEFKVTDEGKTTIKKNEEDKEVDSVKVENNTGVKLPNTGGMGTTVFYVIGGVLVVAAVVLLFAKRRAGAKN